MLVLEILNAKLIVRQLDPRCLPAFEHTDKNLRNNILQPCFPFQHTSGHDCNDRRIHDQGGKNKRLKMEGQARRGKARKTKKEEIWA